MPVDNVQSLHYILAMPSGTTLSQFIDFCKYGEPQPNGQYRLDPVTGGQMTGVINWLIGSHVSEAKFYCSTDTAPILSFGAVVKGASLSWVGISGFPRFLKIGSLELNTANAQMNLEPRTDLDDVFIQRGALPALVPQALRADLDAALKGESGTNLADFLDQVAPLGFREALRVRKPD